MREHEILDGLTHASASLKGALHAVERDDDDEQAFRELQSGFDQLRDIVTKLRADRTRQTLVPIEGGNRG